MGPLTLVTDSCPARPDLVLKLGKRPKEGFRVKIPVSAAGIRRDGCAGLEVGFGTRGKGGGKRWAIVIYEMPQRGRLGCVKASNR